MGVSDDFISKGIQDIKPWDSFSLTVIGFKENDISLLFLCTILWIL